jgi:hypothetical protein
MKALATLLAVIESVVGLGMLTTPSLVWKILLGSPLSAPTELVISRLVGITLLALALACWLLRNEGESRAMRGLVGAMLLFNGGAAGVLLYAGPGLGLFGVGFWPGVLYHTAMGVWCLLSLLQKPGQIPASE